MKIDGWYIWVPFSLLICIAACNTGTEKKQSEIEQVAANKKVADYMKAFKGLGALTDSSSVPTSPEKALEGFRYPADLAMDLVLSEPEVVQPVELSFDQRGRLWVVQYNQYPYPKGLKVTDIDQYIRMKFDKVPAPPPGGVKGADKISFFEDTDGDGKYDKSTDAITGLNIASSVLIGRKSIWVLNPPYLLSYPDSDEDGIPDGQPEVHLSGFGLEDTHSVANSLTWGPDGWIYGAQGSTTTATINSSVSKNIAFKGQAIWRYRPSSHIFELFAEGGGNNPFNVEMDNKGRIYSGSNGVDRGPYYKQGAYYIKSWGKHGPLTNPYTFGYLPNMQHTGEKKRFFHSMIKYEGGALPARYNEKMIALNPLLNYIETARFETEGSDLGCVDEEKILETEDHWFRPVNIKAGPDGAIYIADWYDSRLSHVDPHDTWHKSSGRIYRLRNASNKSSYPKFDLGNYSIDQLIVLLSDHNKWFRQQALRQFGDRKNAAAIPKLMPLLASPDGQTALEGLWAINLSGGFNDNVAIQALNHHDPFVRMWAVRLLGDANRVSSEISTKLALLSAGESDPEVRSQLAATAKRLPSADAFPIIKNLLKNHDDAADPDIPLLIWWAIEAKAETDRNAVLALFEDADLWKKRVVQETILERLAQRYALAGGAENFAACIRLIKLSPSVKLSASLVNGLEEGLRGYQANSLPPELLQILMSRQSASGNPPFAFALRLGQEDAIKNVLSIIVDDKAKMTDKLAYIQIIGETDHPEAVPLLLKIAEHLSSGTALRQSAILALQHYNSKEIGETLVSIYPVLRRDSLVRGGAMELFASRAIWAKQLLNAIDHGKQISKEDVPQQITHRLKLLNDPDINKAAERLWPDVTAASYSEKAELINKFSQWLRSGDGDTAKGHSLFAITCGSCHKLFDKGGIIGPDLTGYERTNTDFLLLNIVDPNADVREGYETMSIHTYDGRTLEGRIMARNGGTITFKLSDGKEIKLPSARIKEMTSLPSIMPEHLLDRMTEQQIRDLFSYIKKKG